MTSSEHRPNSTARGYDHKWARNRARFLKHHPTCIDCGAPSTVADHAPVPRRDLLAAGDPHPDAWHHLQPRCKRCHDQRTARTQPAGFAHRGRRLRPASTHPGLVT